MFYFVVFESTVFAAAVLCMLFFTYVSVNTDILLTVSVITTLVLAIASTVIAACFRERKKLSAGLFSGFFTLLPASQFIAYFYFGSTAVASTVHWRMIFLFLFAVYGIVNLSACFFAHFLMIVRIGGEENTFFLPPVIVFAVGWLINFFLFFN